MQKTKPKAKPVAKPPAEYLKDFNPLSQAHAEAIVAMAGVELDEALLTKIKEVSNMSQVAQPGTEAN